MKLKQNEVEILERKLKDNWAFQIKLGVVGLGLGTLILFIPLAFSIGVWREHLIDAAWFGESFLYMLGFLGFIWIVVYFLNIYSLKKDLKLREKVTGKIKVRKVEHLRARLARQMEGNADTILHFEANPFRIKTFYFNKQLYPEYLEAKELFVERAKYSKIELKSEIIT